MKDSPDYEEDMYKYMYGFWVHIVSKFGVNSYPHERSLITFISKFNEKKE